MTEFKIGDKVEIVERQHRPTNRAKYGVIVKYQPMSAACLVELDDSHTHGYTHWWVYKRCLQLRTNKQLNLFGG